MKNVIILIFSTLATTVCGQNEIPTDSTAMTRPCAPWSLEQCIDYAYSHHISVRQQQNATRQQQVNLDENRGNHLPSVDAAIGQNFSFGRGLTDKNTYENTNTSNTSFSLSASMPLFSGGRIVNGVKQAQLNLDAAMADLQRVRDQLCTQVAKAFVQVIYDGELEEVARRQVSLDSMQTMRLKQLVAVGRASRAELSQQQATLAQSKLTLTDAHNAFMLSTLALTQLLELPSPEGFCVAAPQPDQTDAKQTLPAPDAVYSEALGVRPQVRAEQLRLASYDYAIRIARADYMPTLSLSAGLGTNYYKSSGFAADGFSSQLKNNFSQYLGLNLSIPVFNHFSTRNRIRQAKIERDNQQLRLEDTRKSLYQEIQQAYYNAISSRAKLESCGEAVNSAQDAFQLMQAKYEQGKATITEYNEAKTQMLKAESDQLRARYEHFFNQFLYEFYRH